MISRGDPSSRGLCYFRNLVARCYREARYLGTAGQYQPLEKYYPACKQKFKVGRDWVQPVFQDTMPMRNPTQIEQYFGLRLGGLKLGEMLQAFDQGSWKRNIGGAKWAEIVRVTLELGQAIESDNLEVVTALLHSVENLRHNTRRVVCDFLEPCHVVDSD